MVLNIMQEKNTQNHIKNLIRGIQMNSIGIRLREERNKLGLSQEKLAEIGGVQKLAQTNYETGKRIPTGEYLAKIAEIGADVNYILTGVRVEKAAVEIENSAKDDAVVPIRARQFAEIFQFLNAKQQEEIFAVIEEKKRINALESVVGNMQRQLERMAQAA
jgi:transcriptional regulator with XRE-family HTH domain